MFGIKQQINQTATDTKELETGKLNITRVVIKSKPEPETKPWNYDTWYQTCKNSLSLFKAHKSRQRGRLSGSNKGEAGITHKKYLLVQTQHFWTKQFSSDFINKETSLMRHFGWTSMRVNIFLINELSELKKTFLYILVALSQIFCFFLVYWRCRIMFEFRLNASAYKINLVRNISF